MTVTVTRLDRPDGDDTAGLARVLVDCVDHGASVNFLAPLPVDTARQWWIDALADPSALTWVARDDDGRIVGCVRLVLAQQDNGQHRGEVSKLLVAVDARRTGCATLLLATLETWALEHGRTRLVLDTETGSPAEAFYERHGWDRVGEIPDFAVTAWGDLAPASIYTKGLAATR